MTKKPTQLFLQYGKIALGCALYAVGFQFFFYPNSIVTGGVTGISMIINYLTGLPVGTMSILINIPLFAVAWKKFGFAFLLSSLVGMLLSSVLVDILSLVPVSVTDEPLLGAIYGGIIKGFGLGLVYSASATTGGVDIVAKLLRQRYPYVNFSTLILLLDILVIAAFAVIFRRYDSAMYAIIAMYIMSKVIDLVVYGAINSKVCYIIADKSGAIAGRITRELDRGVTFLRGEGAYSGTEKQVILCAVKPQQIVELRRLVRETDEHAFLIVSDAREIFGNGFTDIYNND